MRWTEQRPAAGVEGDSESVFIAGRCPSASRSASCCFPSVSPLICLRQTALVALSPQIQVIQHDPLVFADQRPNQPSKRTAFSPLVTLCQQ